VQDEFAAASHRKAAAAQAAGKFNAEIVPVRTKVKDPKSGNEQQVRDQQSLGKGSSATDGIQPRTFTAFVS
jgi:acetyl-CoA acyltransferase 1